MRGHRGEPHDAARRVVEESVEQQLLAAVEIAGALIRRGRLEHLGVGPCRHGVAGARRDGRERFDPRRSLANEHVDSAGQRQAAQHTLFPWTDEDDVDEGLPRGDVVDGAGRRKRRERVGRELVGRLRHHGQPLGIVRLVVPGHGHAREARRDRQLNRHASSYHGVDSPMRVKGMWRVGGVGHHSARGGVVPG